jgi:hypothetical protein
MPLRATGFFRQLLEIQLECLISPLVNFRPASEYNPKAAGSLSNHATLRTEEASCLIGRLTEARPPA